MFFIFKKWVCLCEKIKILTFSEVFGWFWDLFWHQNTLFLLKTPLKQSKCPFYHPVRRNGVRIWIQEVKFIWKTPISCPGKLVEVRGQNAPLWIFTWSVSWMKLSAIFWNSVICSMNSPHSCFSISVVSVTSGSMTLT